MDRSNRYVRSASRDRTKGPFIFLAVIVAVGAIVGIALFALKGQDAERAAARAAFLVRLGDFHREAVEVYGLVDRELQGKPASSEEWYRLMKGHRTISFPGLVDAKGRPVYEGRARSQVKDLSDRYKRFFYHVSHFSDVEKTEKRAAFMAEAAQIFGAYKAAYEDFMRPRGAKDR